MPIFRLFCCENGKVGLKQGLIISLQTDTELKRNERFIRGLPYWKYWTIHRWIEEIVGFKRL